MDRWTDARRTNGKIMLLLHTLTMRGSDVASFVEFRLVVLEEIAWQTDGWTTDTRKNNVALTHPYYERKKCSKFGWIPLRCLGGIVWWTDVQTMDAQKNNVTLAHPYHKGKRCSKFGWIPPSGLGGDRVMDRWTMAAQKKNVALTQKNNVTLAHPYHAGKWYSKFGWILPDGLGGDRVKDRWMDNGHLEKTSKFHGEFMSHASFFFEVLKMGKLTRGPLVLYHIPKYWSWKPVIKNNFRILKKKHVHILRPSLKHL